MHDFFYHGIWRMDWGLGNPNKTAALIAMLMIAVWAFANIRKWGFWISLVLFTGLGIGLIHTFSRGGIIALFLGSVPIIYFANRPWPWSKIIGITISIWIMVGVTIFLDAQDRYEQGVIKEDRSIGNRIEIWKAAPQMMVDAPNGWGIGKSGQAYMEWYQPQNHTEQYRTLVNSHLTWLVELGWPLRFLYIVSWFALFLICWPKTGLTALSIPLGVWIAFGIAAVFSSVAESPWLWILPIICLLATIALRWKQKLWPAPILWTIPFGVSAATILALVIVGSGGTGLHAFNGGVVFGNNPPEIWIVVNSKVMGQNYGHAIRHYLSSSDSSNASIGVIESAAAMPDLTGKIVVVADMIPNDDRIKSSLMSAKQIVLLNPSFFPQEINATKEHDGQIRIIFGEFSQSPSTNAWGSVGSVERVPGVGDFLPHWPELALAIK